MQSADVLYRTSKLLPSARSRLCTQVHCKVIFAHLCCVDFPEQQMQQRLGPSLHVRRATHCLAN